MAAVMWIEVLARHGEVAERHRIDTPSARIGRAFDNDVVIDDPHVAAHHLLVSRGEDGVLVAEDLGTLNGLHAEHATSRVHKLALAGAPGLRIGRTVLRVHDAALAVAPERLLAPPRAHATWGAALTAALFAMLLALNWLNLTKEASASLVLLPLLGLATAVAAWSGFWSLLSRIFLGQAHFSLQLRIAVTACIALVLWDQLAETITFGFAWRDMAELASFGAWALLGATCYAHLHAIGPRHMRAAMGLALTLIAAGAVLQYFGKYEARQLVGQHANLGDLRPPAFRVVPLASADDFLTRTEETRARVDKARTREPAAGGLLADLE
jgi:hypothetical protein